MSSTIVPSASAPSRKKEAMSYVYGIGGFIGVFAIVGLIVWAVIWFAKKTRTNAIA